ncbi:uncharacterized protein LOC110409538 isoform X1 [Herrania umbratica]|uniref:Uncharacterized protein LOC110409538 isoform X1 n=1 Tax=Herrania umbratica TaxID=108875 RepID=A0A6J0ZI60_9ROSI|nr:uncharacterized protein LOC110409538 isoform X1 [Herrania umbratica]
MDGEMDPEIIRMFMDFLTWEPVDLMLMKKRLESAPPLDGNPRPKKVFLLLSIKAKILSGNISEEILGHLEMIERIDCSQCLRITDSMNRAYCAVALECTAKYLAVNWGGNGRYLDAVNRIWRGRIANLEKSKASKLVTTEELRSGRRQVEAAIKDEEVANVLIATNSLNEAIRMIKVYLKEAQALMGISSLERECIWCINLNHKPIVVDSLEDSTVFACVKVYFCFRKLIK